jgi:hypothetical protein
MRVLVTILLLLFLSAAASARQPESTPQGAGTHAPTLDRQQTTSAGLDKIEITGSRVGKHYGREWMSVEIILTVALLILTAGLAGGVIYLAKTAQKAWSPQSLLRVLGIVLIIPLAVVLVVAGYSEDQIASVIGLMGVAVGYLLGSGEKPRQDT